MEGSAGTKTPRGSNSSPSALSPSLLAGAFSQSPALSSALLLFPRTHSDPFFGQSNLVHIYLSLLFVFHVLDRYLTS
jgi:hypothetical protein